MTVVRVNGRTHSSYCQPCIYRFHPDMLTGYCLTDCRCDNCGRVSDLAMVRLKEGTPPPEWRSAMLDPEEEARKNHEAHARAKEQRRQEQTPLVTVRMAVAAMRSAADDLIKTDPKKGCFIQLSRHGHEIVEQIVAEELVRVKDIGFLIGEIAQIMARSYDQ